MLFINAIYGERDFYKLQNGIYHVLGIRTYTLIFLCPNVIFV